MVIDDLDVKNIPIFESKTESPLVVNANAPLTFTIATQCLKSVARRDAEVIESKSAIKHLQFAFGNPGQRFEFSRAFTFEQGLRVFAAESFDHRNNITPDVKRQADRSTETFKD